jgi:Flp pilus assembly protein TadG
MVRNSPSQANTRKATTLLGRFKQNRDGVTAVEFGLVAAPFLAFALGIIAVGLQFFTINTLDQAVEKASRKIRTGQAQRANMTLGDFKNLVCESGGYYLQKDCNNIFIHVQNSGSWADITPTACATNGQMTTQANTTGAVSDSAGGGSQVVLVTVCYDWLMPLSLPYLQYLLMRPADGVPLVSGGSLIQSVATFRSENF